MGEAESQGEEPGGRSETAREAKERARRLRAQAELAWAGVQRAAHRGPSPAASIDRVLKAAERIPVGSYLGGIAGSLLASAWLQATGRRTASLCVGTIAPLVFGAGLLSRLSRRRATASTTRSPR